MKWVLAQNIPINYHLAILGDEEGHTIVFNSKHEAEDFIERSGEDPKDVMAIPKMEIIERRLHD